MKLSFSGLGEVVATFSGNVKVGDIVSIGDNESVAKANADKDFIGVCVSNNSKLAGILLKGAVTVSYTGAAPTVGYVGLVTAGSNAVKVAVDAKKTLVLSVDTVHKTVTVML